MTQPDDHGGAVPPQVAQSDAAPVVVREDEVGQCIGAIKRDRLLARLHDIEHPARPAARPTEPIAGCALTTLADPARDVLHQFVPCVAENTTALGLRMAR